jgi:hypothetical protein
MGVGSGDQLLAINTTTGSFARGSSLPMNNQVTGFVGVAFNTNQITARSQGIGQQANATPYSSYPDLNNYYVFARNINNIFSSGSPTSSRLAFYSIGESLNLAALDARVTDLINAIGAAIP